MPNGEPSQPGLGSARIGPDAGAVATRAILSNTAGSGMDQLLLASRHERRFAPLPTRCLLRGVHVLTPADSADALRSHFANAGSTCRTGSPSSSDGDPTQDRFRTVD